MILGKIQEEPACADGAWKNKNYYILLYRNVSKSYASGYTF